MRVWTAPVAPATPFATNSRGNSLGAGRPSYQSPFNQTGRGTCDPLIHLTNFNVVVSGANVLQTNLKYTWEQFIEQTYGVNALNAGMLDGITSGLIDKYAFENQYNYIYVDISRQQPVEKQVPKSVQLIGKNNSKAKIDLFIFLEYEAGIQIDKLTGARL